MADHLAQSPDALALDLEGTHSIAEHVTKELDAIIETANGARREFVAALLTPGKAHEIHDTISHYEQKEPQAASNELTPQELRSYIEARAEGYGPEEDDKAAFDNLPEHERSRHARAWKMTEDVFRSWTVRSKVPAIQDTTRDHRHEIRTHFNTAYNSPEGLGKARQEVIETLGKAALEAASGNDVRNEQKESGELSKLIEQVVAGARSNTYILTSLATGTEHNNSNGEKTVQGPAGFATIGEVRSSKQPMADDLRHLTHKATIIDRDGTLVKPAELYSITPAKHSVTKTVQTPKRFGRTQTETVSQIVPVVGPNGEEMSYLDYSYYPQGNAGEPPYLDPATGRDGNMLLVRAAIPNSLVPQIDRVLSEDPNAIRGIVQALAIQNGGIHTSAWTGVPQETRPIQPNYPQGSRAQRIAPTANGTWQVQP